VADRPARTLVIGIGNTDRGDDGAGCFVARRIAAARVAGVEVIEHRAELSLILPRLAAAGRVFLVDASVSGAAPGTSRRFDAGAGPLPALPRKLSAHGLDLGEAIELARTLGQLPAECVVYAIEAGQCDTGGALTPAVERAVATVAEALLAEINAGGRATA
jgi:hydrogenase maturation protease